MTDTSERDEEPHQAAGDVDPSVAGEGRRASRVKIAGLVLFAAAACVVYFLFRDELSLIGLAAHEDRLRRFQREHPVAVYGLAFLIYTALTGLSLPLAGGLTVAFGWFFGFWQGVILVSFASVSGSTIAFLMSRYLFRDMVQRKFGDRLARFNQALQREGAFYLFTLRLIVAVPFFVINVVMGLTPIRVWTFWWVSQLGMLPGTSVYVYAGSTVPSLQALAERGTRGILNWQILLALVLLGVFPLAVKKTMGWIRPHSVEALDT